eukprot:CAMPEP_0175478154 /NCGR_PEP_ID=MMETSP0095-20121207/76789_1 /TAXON_ID=311494 /ORGANISM="Alexandrium monilatum, Strain CCMP3105" /LENGTH=78 /DNA_ID=CAMNT_0016779749 /DNA_START=40 /DNA_END=274 /DNA_ORIENTATION=+
MHALKRSRPPRGAARSPLEEASDQRPGLLRAARPGPAGLGGQGAAGTGPRLRRAARGGAAGLEAEGRGAGGRTAGPTP